MKKSRTNNNIGQRVAYPTGMRKAVVKAYTKANVKSSEVAEDFNIHKSTVCTWARQANNSKPQPKQLAAAQAAAAATKAFNTPTVIYDAKGNISGITLKGKLYI